MNASTRAEFLTRRLFAVSATLSLAGLASVQAFADDTPWYIGASIGYVKNDLNLADFDDGSIVSGHVDTDETALKLLGGYRLSRYFAIEAGYVSLRNDLDSETTFTGVSDGTGPGFSSFPNEEVSVDIDKQAGFVLSLIASYPITADWLLDVKAGAFFWDADVTTLDLDGARDTSFDGTDPVYGIGIEHRFTNNLAIRADFDRFADIVDHDFDVLGLTVLYDF